MEQPRTHEAGAGRAETPKKKAAKKSAPKAVGKTGKPVRHEGKSKKSDKARRRRGKRIRRIVGRALLYIFTVLVMLVLGLYAILNVVFNGPSQTAGDRLTLTLLETSALKFVPGLYYTDEEIAAVKERNKVVELEQETDTSLIVFSTPDDGEEVGPVGSLEEERDIVVEEIGGATYHGWMMIVRDPSRVFVGVCNDHFSEDRPGLKLPALVKKYDAIAGINGGAFSDPSGQGNGGVPIGPTFSEGRATNAYGGGDLTVAGFDENNVLIVGKMSKDQCKQRGIRDSVAFGPALVVNGEPAQFSGVSSGLNPRSAIGQRSDGAVLMLVIDGRQVNSPGASMADLVEIMVRYGAVNACNLDGGRIPTAFLVR